jgi:hypothetical protein
VDVVAFGAARITRPDELSDTIICFREGTKLECLGLVVEDAVEAEEMRDVRRGRFETGSRRERFVSAPMMRCEAVRWFRAATNWGVVNAGLRGT